MFVPGCLVKLLTGGASDPLAPQLDASDEELFSFMAAFSRHRGQ
jgi:hypothetical protein